MITKLLIKSDLHLEFSNMLPRESEADIIILAGDIWKGDNGIHWARGTWPNKEIIYVASNHEFYGKNRLNVVSMLRTAAAETGVNFLDNDEVVIGGLRYLGATLWTDFKLFGEDQQYDCMAEAEGGLNDFRVIHEGAEGHFSTMHALTLHQLSVDWLTKAIRSPFEGKTVVVTHHAPSFTSVVPRFQKDLLSAYLLLS